MYARRHGKGWQVQVYAGRKPDGTPDYRYATGRTKQDALDAGDDLRAEIRREQDLGDDCTLGELLDRWFDHARATRGWSAGNVSQTRYRLRRIKSHKIVDRSVKKLRVRDLDAYYTFLRNEGAANGDRLAGSTVTRWHSDISSALTQAVVWEVIQSNPAAYATPGSIDPSEAVAPLDEEVQALTARAFEWKADFGAFLVAAAVIGGRRGELLALQRRDLAGREVHIRRSLTYGDDGLEVKDWPKTKKSRRVGIDVDTEWTLASVLERQDARARAGDAEVKPTGFVFSDEPDGSKPWLPNTVTHQFIRLRREVGLPERFELRDLRDYSASVLIAAGVDIATVSHRLGHAKISTTLDIYTHMLEANDRAAADVVGAVVHRQPSLES